MVTNTSALAVHTVPHIVTVTWTKQVLTLVLHHARVGVGCSGENTVYV